MKLISFRFFLLTCLMNNLRCFIHSIFIIIWILTSVFFNSRSIFGNNIKLINRQLSCYTFIFISVYVLQEQFLKLLHMPYFEPFECHAKRTDKRWKKKIEGLFLSSSKEFTHNSNYHFMKFLGTIYNILTYNSIIR